MERKFLVVSYKNQNKKIAVEEVSYTSIREVVLARFSVSNIEIKYYDRDVDDWVDLEADSDEFINDLRIVKLKLNERHTLNGQEAHDNRDGTATTQRSSTPPPVRAPSPVASTSTAAASVSRAPSSPQPSSNGSLTPPPPPQLPAISQPDTPQTPSQEAGRNTTLQRQIPSKAWCRTYRMPKGNIARGVLFKLDHKEQLTTSERRNVLDAIYNDVTQFRGGMYPTSEMYEDIVDALLREFPHLSKYGGLPPSSAREFWKDKVIYKFGNARKSLDKDHPEVKQKKKKQGNERSQAEADTPASFTWGLGKFLPPIPETEDDTSIDLHIKWLQREFRKTTADIDVRSVELKMDLTFPSRRHAIVEDKMALTQLLERFPWLQTKKEIFKEFTRLEPRTEKKEIKELLANGLQVYRKAIVKALRGKKKPNFLQDVEEASQHYRTEGQRQNADDCVALAGLPLLLKEKPDKVIMFGERVEHCSVGIVCRERLMTVDNDAFEIVVDGSTILKCDSFVEAYSALIATIYDFNLAYPKPWEKTMTYVQNILIGLRDNDGANIDRRILSAVTAINKEL